MAAFRGSRGEVRFGGASAHISAGVAAESRPNNTRKLTGGSMLNNTARWSLACAFALALAFTFCLPAKAQTYPAKSITVIVPFAAGGPTDTVARLVTAVMAK